MRNARRAWLTAVSALFASSGVAAVLGVATVRFSLRKPVLSAWLLLGLLVPAYGALLTRGIL